VNIDILEFKRFTVFLNHHQWSNTCHFRAKVQVEKWIIQVSRCVSWEFHYDMVTIFTKSDSWSVEKHVL